MGGLEYRLSQVELHGNRLQSLDHVMQCLRHCANLRSLAVAQAGADNPLCQIPGKLTESLCAILNQFETKNLGSVQKELTETY